MEGKSLLLFSFCKCDYSLNQNSRKGSCYAYAIKTLKMPPSPPFKVLFAALFLEHCNGNKLAE